jgi:hypothetical protein
MQQGLLLMARATTQCLCLMWAQGTRQQVINEMLNESPAERSERLRLYSPG